MPEPPAWPTAELIRAIAAELAAVETTLVRIETKLDSLIVPIIVFEVGAARDKPVILFTVGAPQDKEI